MSRRRLPLSRSVLPAVSADGVDSRPSLADLLPLDPQLDLGGIRSEEQGYCPVEDNAQSAIPAWHLEQVVRPADPPRDETSEVDAEDTRHGARVPERCHCAERLKDERRRGAP